MKVPNLNKIQHSDATVIINIDDLVLNGLSINEDFEIPEKFHYAYNLKGDQLFYLHIGRSNGTFDYLEFHYGFILEPTDSNENVHISQEILIFEDEEGHLSFTCPILGSSKVTKKLYFRNDFPLFGSGEALNISDR